MTAARFSVSPLSVVLGAAVLIAAGAGAGIIYERSQARPAGGAAAAVNPATNAATNPAAHAGHESPPASGPVNAEPSGRAVTLTDEAIARAGITTSPVVAHQAGGELRLTATIQPNSYTHTPVTSLVAGRVTQVDVEVGSVVRRGQRIAQVHSPELAEAQKAYVSARAQIEAHDRELERTQKLAGIGAASQQELERAHAEHATMSSEAGSAAARLELLGMTPEAIRGLTSLPAVSALFEIPSPRAGVVLERGINPGQNIDASTPVATIADLSTVWVVADVFERDVAHVTRGAPVTVMVPALPDVRLSGRISYIAPHLNHETRTAQARVELPNRDGRLLLGMYAQVVLASAGEREALAVPRTALQSLGNRTVVYVRETGSTRFVERRVEPRADSAPGDLVQVDGDLTAGEQVVSGGSFFVRAELERRGAAATDTVSPAADTISPAAANSSVVAVTVSEAGFTPNRVTTAAGRPVRLVFTRTSANTCATALRVPALHLDRELPLNQPVEVTVVAERGELTFECGQEMFKGSVVVQ